MAWNENKGQNKIRKMKIQEIRALNFLDDESLIRKFWFANFLDLEEKIFDHSRQSYICKEKNWCEAIQQSDVRSAGYRGQAESSVVSATSFSSHLDGNFSCWNTVDVRLQCHPVVVNVAALVLHCQSDRQREISTQIALRYSNRNVLLLSSRKNYWRQLCVIFVR